MIGPLRGTLCGRSVLGSGFDDRVRPGVHGGLVSGHQPPHHVGRRAVFGTHFRDLGMLIMSFRGGSFDHEEVADFGLNRPPLLDCVRLRGPLHRARIRYETEVQGGSISAGGRD